MVPSRDFDPVFNGLRKYAPFFYGGGCFRRGLDIGGIENDIVYVPVGKGDVNYNSGNFTAKAADGGQ